MKKYVCPGLMWIQFALLKLWPFGRRVSVRNGRLIRWMPKGHGVEVGAWWPRWLIHAECRFHNSRVGVRLRVALR